MKLILIEDYYQDAEMCQTAVADFNDEMVIPMSNWKFMTILMTD